MNRRIRKKVDDRGGYKSYKDYYEFRKIERLYIKELQSIIEKHHKKLEEYNETDDFVKYLKKIAIEAVNTIDSQSVAIIKDNENATIVVDRNSIQGSNLINEIHDHAVRSNWNE